MIVNLRDEDLIRFQLFRFIFLLLPFLQVSFAVGAENSGVTTGAYIDAYYAYDFNKPTNLDRSFATQPARHNEFNINLAHIEFNLSRSHQRGRLALQAGTSVQSNYSSEPKIGTYSGPSLSQLFQEARVGYQLQPSTWVDGGIFFSHLGCESWISKENITLTRSLVAEYSPYYLAGIKLTHNFSEKIQGQVLIVNGWQIISENNSDKSLGTSLNFDLGALNFSYNALLGQEISPNTSLETNRPSRFRHFHNFIFKGKWGESWDWITQLDLGFQKMGVGSEYDSWSGGTLLARFSLDQKEKYAFRLEHFNDPKQIVMSSGLTQGTSISGFSVGRDKELDEGLLWRVEYRLMQAQDEVFSTDTTNSKGNQMLVTSLAVSI